MYGFYLSCPSAMFALQDGCSVPREWPAAKGLFKSAFETLLNGEIGVPGEKPLGERERTRNKLNPAYCVNAEDLNAAPSAFTASPPLLFTHAYAFLRALERKGQCLSFFCQIN